MKKINVRWWQLAVGCGLAATGVGVYLTYDRLDQKNRELEAQVVELTKREQQSVVMQRVNAQMEEIANEERRISDEQREAAEEQTRVAERERQNAEQQRHQAEQERQNALAAEHKAVEASHVAQSQRQIAEQQRTEAEYSKRVTDTLSFLTLARSLGTSATNQYYAGNHEIAEMLAYTATMYTNRYHGDIYAPTVYQAMALTSQNKNVWNKHKGSITDIEFLDNKGQDFVSCSTYGEVLRHHQTGTNLKTETLVRNPRYDFRDVYIDRKTSTVYAISRSSHVLVIRDNTVQDILEVSLPKLSKMEQLGNHFVLFGEKGIASFDGQTVGEVKMLPHRIITVSASQHMPLVFDDHGNEYLIKSINSIETKQVGIKGQVTAYAESKNEHIKAYGMSDGTLYFVNAQGKSSRLSGHRSQISKIKINGHRIYTASYDGMMNLWMSNMTKMEPMTLFQTNGWIINFTYDPTKTYIWTGDQKGNLTESLISVPLMQERLKNRVKRNFTKDEWNYYIGRNVAYEDITKGKTK